MSGSTFRQNGEDRARYGEILLDNLAKEIHLKGLSARDLKLYRPFYLAYPQLNQEVIKHLKNVNINLPSIVQTMSAQLQITDNESIATLRSLIFNNLSFSHLSDILSVKDPLKRTFYEMECINCVWTHKELQRQ